MKRNRDAGAADEGCDVLGDLAARAAPEREPALAQWRAIASALHRRRPRLLFLVPAAATLAAALAITSQLSLRYRLDHCKATEGKLVVAPSSEGTVEFEDGSRFVLTPGTQAEIQTRGFRRGAQLRLHQGHTNVSIVHRFAGRWDVVAGAFDVHVTGTRFEVDWRPDNGRFDL